MRIVVGYGIVFICVLIEVCCENYLKEQPSWLSPCDVQKPDHEQCFSTDLQNLIDAFRDGVPGFKAFKSLDPFEIKRLYIDESANGAVNFKMNLLDIKLSAFRNVIVSEAKYVSSSEWRHKFFFPKLKMEGRYTMDGRILVLPIRGEGKFLLETENMQANVISKVKLFERDNHRFFNVTRVKVDYKIEGFKVNAENLFNGNKELSDTVNTFLNENWQDVSEAMKPTILRSLEEVMREVSRAVFDFVPADYFIKDIKKIYNGT